VTSTPFRRVSSAVENLSAKARTRVEQERERRFVVALGFAIADRGRQAAASVLAGALAFRLFLTLLPLTLVLIVGLGFLKSAGGTPSDALKQFGIKGVLASTINHSANFHDPGRTAILLLGLFGLLSAARTTAATLRAIHALAWGIPVVRWRRAGVATLIFLGGVVIAFVCGGIATRVRVAAGEVVGFGTSLVMASVVAAAWLGASWLLPHRDGIRWTALLPGAVLVGIGFAGLQVLTANLVGPKLQHESALYGSLGVSFVVLGWLYLVGRLMVAAPLLNVALLDHRSPRFAVASQEAPSGAAAQDALSAVAAQEQLSAAGPQERARDATPPEPTPAATPPEPTPAATPPEPPAAT
jgi:uncharacterized BrkB/YihY/UPF0761 family membrane protein